MDVDLGKDSLDCVGLDQRGNVCVDVFDATVHVDLCYRSIDVPNCVWLRSPDANFWFRGMDAIPGSLPALFSNDPKPACLRCKYFSEFASKSDERACRVERLSSTAQKVPAGT